MLKKILLLFILGLYIPLQGQGFVTVKATGYGKTERDALEEARRNAVIQGIDDLFSDVPQKKEIIKGKVVDKPTAYLKNEEILNKEFDSDTQKWEFKIKATVSRSDLEKDVGGIDVILDRMNRPKVLVIPVKYSNESEPKKLIDLAVNTINEYMGRLGFNYIALDAVSHIMNEMSEYSGSQNYGDIAMKANAPYYITVNITMNERGRGAGNAYYSNVNINLEAFDTENGTGVGTSNKSSGEVGSITSQNEANFSAIKSISTLAAEDIVQQILMYFERIVERGSFYEVRIFGISDYLIAREFKDALVNHEGFVGDIRMSKNEDYFRFEITYKSPRPDEVIDAVFDALVGKVNFRKLNLRDASGKLINFVLQ